LKEALTVEKKDESMVAMMVACLELQSDVKMAEQWELY
jgi:hypothetical protein